MCIVYVYHFYLLLFLFIYLNNYLCVHWNQKFHRSEICDCSQFCSGLVIRLQLYNTEPADPGIQSTFRVAVLLLQKCCTQLEHRNLLRYEPGDSVCYLKANLSWVFLCSSKSLYSCIHFVVDVFHCRQVHAVFLNEARKWMNRYWSLPCPVIHFVQLLLLGFWNSNHKTAMWKSKHYISIHIYNQIYDDQTKIFTWVYIMSVSFKHSWIV